jgi:hypothetical protein
MLPPYSTHQYQTAQRLMSMGVQEIPGPDDNELIELSHILTGVAKQDFSSNNTDSIPWCSSGMNLNVIVTNWERNPAATYKMLKARGFNEDIIKRTYYLSVFDNDAFNDAIVYKSLNKVPEPTWSAAAKSWATWGHAVKEKNLKLGNVVVLTRDGGGHCGLFEARNTLTYSLLGYNQGDKLQTSDTLLKARAYAFRQWLG